MNTTHNDQLQAKPFLRWAGGKNWFIKHLTNDLLPLKFNNYHEPFLGGGSVFFNIKNDIDFYISDINNELINTYCRVRENVEEIISELRKMSNNKEDYYIIRSRKYESEIERAAQFIYLNKTYFNGIYRVNRQGTYNVPYGYRHKVDYVDETNLRAASVKLRKTNVSCLDFEEALSRVQKMDFVFLDPPYTVAHENNGFIEYNQKIFTLDDQYRLANAVKRLQEIGAFYIITNAFHAKIKEVYNDLGTFQSLERKSLIGGKNAKRESIKEYIIVNF